MAQVCKCCQLGTKKVKQLESDYVNGVNLLQLSRTYGISRDSVKYHLNHHLPERVVQGAQTQLELHSGNLLEKIDQLYSWAQSIFNRNYTKERDRTALKALSEQRVILELLGKISFALHQSKLADLEKSKQEMLQADIPLERLTKREQEVYFQILQKLSGDRETIDLTGYTDSDYTPIRRKRAESDLVDESEDEQEREGQYQNSSQTTTPPPRLRRTRFAREQPTEEDSMRFKPIPKSAPLKDAAVERSRRSFVKMVHREEGERYPNTPGSPFL